MADRVNSNLDLRELFSLVSELQSKIRNLESALDCPKSSRPVKFTNWKSDQHTGSRCLETPFLHPTARDADAETHPIALVSNLFMKRVILNDTPVTGLIDTRCSHVLVRCSVARRAKVEVRPVTCTLYTADTLTSHPYRG